MKMENKFKNFSAATVVLTLAVCFIAGCIASAKSSTNEKKDYDVRIMSANLLAHYESWGGIPVGDRDLMFRDVLNEYTPDVVGLQEICEDWKSSLTQNMPENYSFVQTDSAGDFVHMTAMIYNTDTLTLTDCGEIEFSKLDDKRTRRAVWAVFETNDGLRFAATSTHFSFLRGENDTKGMDMTNVQADEMCELSEQIKNEYNCTVFLTGDFNTKESTGENEPSSEIYNKLCTSLTDAKYCALSTFNGDGYSIDKPCIDHIFMNGEATVQSFGYLSDTHMRAMSDHYPILADVKL